MNVVDSSGWIEYFTDGTNARFFLQPIQELEHLVVPSLCIYEVFKRLLRDLGEEAALQAAGIMSHGQVIDLDQQIAIEAARLSCELKLAMADSLILATARTYEAVLWTQDEHFKGMDEVKFFEKKRVLGIPPTS